MRVQFVGDDRTIIGTQGVRFVEKVDATYGGPTTYYELRVTYKGDRMDYRYIEEAVRDAQFDRLRRALAPQTTQAKE